MSLLSTAAQNASLDNDYGATKGAASPANLEVALFNGDPLLGGTELTATGGYVAVTVGNDGTTWPSAATSGGKTTSTIAFATSTDAWSDVATFFVLRDASTGDQWDSGPLTDEISVETSGTEVTTTITVYYEDLGA